MLYNEELDARITQVVSNWGTTKKKMFGGTCHFLNGNMVCGVYKEFLVLRLGVQAAAESLKQPHVTPFDITGRPMRGWVKVDYEAFQGKDLPLWLDKARQYVKTLPPK